MLLKSCVLPDFLKDIHLLTASGPVCSGTLDGSKVCIKCVSMDLKVGPRKVKEVRSRRHVFQLWAPTKAPGLLPSGCIVETLSTSKHRPTSGRHHRPLPTRFGPDVRRRSNRVYHEQSRCGQALSRSCLLYLVLCCTMRLSPYQIPDVAKGLNFLHSRNVIHGDLNGVRDRSRSRFTTVLTSTQPNVLVDATGCARTTDIGLVMVTQDLDLVRNASGWRNDRARWIAPEILDDLGTYSKEGMFFHLRWSRSRFVLYDLLGADIRLNILYPTQAFAGAVPFNNYPPHAVVSAIVGGHRPPRPTHPAFTDGLWSLTQRCWDQEARLRPQVLEVLAVLCDS